ncbi:hypothetical protein EW146_g2088 [Bondarzewia mesenterica]|uniref:Uncharacterized protein n=1 Tax=Bondarzewia mesenterica TaxID=1095465 RepID=A0A4S4M1Q3_9AGAM|nr:hypothetical protein EW146_g2088 [Bondarzewia mesenterica]
MEYEISLRAHIRHLLDEYVLNHLTVDFSECTQSLIYEILSNGLTAVPTTDPQSLALPSDPLDDLMKMYCSQLSVIPEILWEADKLTVELMQKALNFSSEPKTERCWKYNALFELEQTYTAPMSSVLTTRAIQQTPKLGSSSVMKRLPKSLQDSVKDPGVRSVSKEIFREPDILQEDLLRVYAIDIQLELDLVTRKAVLESYQTNPFARRKPGDSCSALPSESWSRSNSPPLPLIRPISPALFSRQHTLGSRSSINHAKDNFASMTDISSMVPLHDEHNSSDIDQQHLTVVNGWQTIAHVSSPSSLSSRDDGSEKMDELCLPSPATEPMIISELEKTISEVVMPMSESIGGIREKFRAPGEMQSFDSFVARMNPMLVTMLKPPPVSQCGDISMSMLGQPPTIGDANKLYGSPAPTSISDWKESFDEDTRKLYGSLSKDFNEVILTEQIGHSCDLMNPPKLPPPNEHHHNLALPNNLSSLVYDAARGPDSTGLAHSMFGVIRKIKGIQPLNIELSWRPFKHQTKIPTHDELAQVTNTQNSHFFCDTVDTDDFVQRILGRNEFSTSRPVLPSIDEILLLRRMAQSPPFKLKTCTLLPGEDEHKLDLLLTREERQRLGRLRGDESDQGGDSLTDPEDNEGDRVRVTTNIKRLKRDDQAGPTAHFFFGDGHEDKHHLLTVNDSGIAMMASFMEEDADILQREVESMGRSFPRFQAYHYPGDTISHFDPEHFAEPPSAALDDWDLSLGDTAETFVPLSLDSTRPIQTTTLSQIELSTTTDACGRDWFDESVSSNLPASSIPSNTTTSASNGTAVNPSAVLELDVGDETRCSVETGLFKESAHQSLADFMLLRAKATHDQSYHTPDISAHEANGEIVIDDAITDEGIFASASVPLEIIDRLTLCIPATFTQPDCTHRYLASLGFIQKRQLVRSLCSPGLGVDLIERETLNDVDIIIDFETAVLCLSLSSLPSQLAALKSRLEHLSWRYLHILIVFETYPPSMSYRPDDAGRLTPYAFSPPVMKAIRRLRRDLAIAEAYYVKRAEATVQFAFAKSVDEAATYTRIFGDHASQRSAPEIWGERLWLDEAQEGELELANADGMNIFAAAVILSQVPLSEFLAMTAEQRAENFSWLVGQDRISQFNDYISSRYESIRSATSSPDLNQVAYSSQQMLPVTHMA